MSTSTLSHLSTPIKRPRRPRSPRSSHEAQADALFAALLSHVNRGELDAVRSTAGRLRVHGYRIEAIDAIGLRLVPVPTHSTPN